MVASTKITHLSWLYYIAAVLIAAFPPLCYAQSAHIQEPLKLVSGPPRVALVIGNATYSGELEELKHAVADADAISIKLRKAGFAVIKALNTTKDSLDSTFQLFKNTLQSRSQATNSNSKMGRPVGLLYYSGHGALSEEKGYEFIVGVDERSKKIRRPILLNQLALDISNNTSAAILIFDACRSYLQIDEATMDSAKGEKRLGSTPETVIALGSAAGVKSTIYAGQDHSVFTKRLLEYIPAPGLEIRILLGRVGGRVGIDNTRQEPEAVVNISREFYFTPLQINAP